MPNNIRDYVELAVYTVWISTIPSFCYFLVGVIEVVFCVRGLFLVVVGGPYMVVSRTWVGSAEGRYLT